MNLALHHGLDLPIIEPGEIPTAIWPHQLPSFGNSSEPYFLRGLNIETPAGYTLRQALATADDEFERMKEVFGKWPGFELEVVNHTWALYRGFLYRDPSKRSTNKDLVPYGFSLAAVVDRVDGEAFQDSAFHPILSTQIATYNHTKPRNNVRLRDVHPRQILRQQFFNSTRTYVDIEPRLVEI